MAKIAETEALSVAAPRPASSPEVTVNESLDTASPLDAADWRPKRLVRTVLSSLAASEDWQANGAGTKRRRFFEATARAFLGDGLPWNWSIWKAHFRDFTAILDFIHVLSYLFVAAKAVHGPEEAWSQYLVWMRGCWRGEVAKALEELRHWQTRLGEPPQEASDNDPRSIVATTITYLGNNQKRMHYPEYRRQGLPVTTAWMESLVKEVNYRVKGTEMFWNNPEGAEAILQVRAAALCDDERLIKHLRNRPGHPFTRRPKIRKVTAKKTKADVHPPSLSAQRDHRCGRLSDSASRLDVPEYAIVNAMNNRVRPESPVRCRPETVLVQGASFQKRLPSRQRRQQELTLLRERGSPRGAAGGSRTADSILSWVRGCSSRRTAAAGFVPHFDRLDERSGRELAVPDDAHAGPLDPARMGRPRRCGKASRSAGRGRRS